MKTLSKLTAAAALAALAFAATGAQAHAHLVSSTPTSGAEVGAPQKLHLEFSEKLEPKFSGADLMKTDGAAIPVSAKIAGKTIDASPKAPLAPGQYMVMWHAVAADGHKTSGDYNFTVK